uniref:Uncharacterized protein n=1 Tax=Oryza glumipatula TaxID=40148 RepID=A0A0D9Y9H4_9ORYZ
MATAMERRWWRPQIRRRRGGRRWAAHAGIPRLPLAFSGTPLASAGIGGESLAPLSVLATAMPLGAVHLLEGVATGALIHVHFKRFLRVKT